MKTFKTDEDLFDELKDKYTKLITANRTLFEENVARGKRIELLEQAHKHSELAHHQKNQRIELLTTLLDEAVKTLSIYVNVPEADRLKEAWKKIKAPVSQ